MCSSFKRVQRVHISGGNRIIIIIIILVEKYFNVQGIRGITIPLKTHVTEFHKKNVV
jgi:hypothetical protein